MIAITATGALLAKARSEILVMTMDVAVVTKRIHRANLGRGVTYQVIAPDTARITAAMGRLSVAGVRTRTVSDVPADLIIIDRTDVILPSDTARGLDGPLTRFHQAAIVTAAIELFERVWASAAPPIGSGRPMDTELSDT